MAETHVISALVKKRSEVSGEIKHYENLLKKAKTDLQSIDQTIRRVVKYQKSTLK